MTNLDILKLTIVRKTKAKCGAADIFKYSIAKAYSFVLRDCADFLPMKLFVAVDNELRLNQ